MLVNKLMLKLVCETFSHLTLKKYLKIDCLNTFMLIKKLMLELVCKTFLTS